MKTAVSSYSFYRVSGMPQFDCIKKAKEIGFDGIEFSGLSPREGESVTDYAKALVAEAKTVGIPIINYCTGADFLKADSIEKEAERLFVQVDLAAILGVKTMRHDATFGFKDGTRSYRGFDTEVAKIADGCRKVTRYAASKGIKTMIENHGQLVQESARVEKLIHTVADENFGQLVDIGNFMCADEAPELAVGRNAPYAFHVHVKDFLYKSGSQTDPGEGWFKTRAQNYIRGAIIGHGVVPIVQCLKILKSNGYDGYVSIEFEGMEEPLNAIRIGLDNLKKYIQMV